MNEHVKANPLKPDALDVEEVIFLRADELVALWELADPRDCWRYTNELPPVEPPAKANPYRTPQSTIDAFLYVARNHDADYLARWLEKHPQDAAALIKLWEAKNGKA
jgi:hypothetical protein